MKNITKLLAVLSLALAVGCKKKADDASTPPAGGDKPAETAPKPAEPAMEAPGPTGKITGLPPKCTAYLEYAAKYITCDKVTAEEKTATQTGADQIKSMYTDTEHAEFATKNCGMGLDMLKKAADAHGCKI